MKTEYRINLQKLPKDNTLQFIGKQIEQLSVNNIPAGMDEQIIQSITLILKINSVQNPDVNDFCRIEKNEWTNCSYTSDEDSTIHFYDNHLVSTLFSPYEYDPTIACEICLRMLPAEINGSCIAAITTAAFWDTFIDYANTKMTTLLSRYAEHHSAAITEIINELQTMLTLIQCDSILIMTEYITEEEDDYSELPF